MTILAAPSVDIVVLAEGFVTYTARLGDLIVTERCDSDADKQKHEKPEC